MTRQPERNETNAARQARLRERRKAQGFKRVSVWLSPDQVDRMERQGGEPWLGRIVKQLLESAVVEPTRPPAKQVALFVVPDLENGNGCRFEPEPAQVAPGENGQPTSDKAALFQDAKRLRAVGVLTPIFWTLKSRYLKTPMIPFAVGATAARTQLGSDNPTRNESACACRPDRGTGPSVDRHRRSPDTRTTQPPLL